LAEWLRHFKDLAVGVSLPLRVLPREARGSRSYDLIFAGSCLNGLGIVMKKPLSIRGHMMVLSSTAYPYEKIRSVFSLRVVIHEFFQKKLNYIKATPFFLYDPLTTSFTRLWRDCMV
jgi:hypothetical protein